MSFTLKKSNLDFKVYTVPTKPTTAGAENDIAIISSVPMPNWILSPDKPSGIPRSDGDGWIQYSVKGDTFNALKQNAMMIATISAWQYVDGAWLDREAVSCQSGEWVDWISYLFKNGKFGGELSDGFVPVVSGTVVEIRNNDLVIYRLSSSGAAVSKNRIDTTGHKRIVFKGRNMVDTTVPSNYQVFLSTSQSNASADRKSSVLIPYSETPVTFELPVPTNGGIYYLGFDCGGVSIAGQGIEIKEMVWE